MEGLSSTKPHSPRRIPRRGTSTARSSTRAREPARSPRSSSPRPGWDGTRRGIGNAIDDLYLSEMAESSVLTAPQELEIGERIASAEQDLVRALFASPSGAERLVALGQ